MRAAIKLRLKDHLTFGVVFSMILFLYIIGVYTLL